MIHGDISSGKVTVGAAYPFVVFLMLIAFFSHNPV